MLSIKFKKELKVSIKLAFPIIIAQLGVVLMGVTDNIMVGQFLGKIALGASGVANSIAFLIASIAVGGMSVIAPMVSKFHAEKKPESIKSLFNSTLWVAIIFSLALSFFGFLAYVFFDVFQQPASINAIVLPFFSIILVSNIPLYFFLGIKQFADGLSQPNVVMYITVSGLIINVFGNYFLINGIGFIPAMGIMGAGYSTLITRLAMFIFMFLFLKKANRFSVYFRNLNLRFEWNLVKEILNRSLPGGSQLFFEIAAFSLAVIMMGWISETALAAHQIAINIASTTYMMATGIAFAGSIRVGNAWGNRNPKGIRTAGYASYFIVLVFMSITTVLILIFKIELLTMFINDKEVIEHAIPLVLIAAFFQLSDGIQVVGLGALRGLADIKVPTFFTFFSYWMVSLPLGYYLAFKAGYGSVGIWIGLLVGLTFSAVLMYYRFTKLITLQKLKLRFKKVEVFEDV